MNINIFTSSWLYEPKNDEREAEFLFCYNKNKKLNFNVYYIDNNKRTTYNKLFNETKNYPKDINIIANADNFFTKDFLKKLHKIYSKNKSKEKLCLALTRWNYFNENNIVFQKSGQSQDVFIFYGTLNLDSYDDITMGVPGCDNRLTSILIHDFKLNVYNPSIDLMYFHYHPSGNYTRTYLNDKGERNCFIDGPYEFIDPCQIINIK